MHFSNFLLIHVHLVFLESIQRCFTAINFINLAIIIAFIVIIVIIIINIITPLAFAIVIKISLLSGFIKNLIIFKIIQHFHSNNNSHNCYY